MQCCSARSVFFQAVMAFNYLDVEASAQQQFPCTTHQHGEHIDSQTGVWRNKNSCLMRRFMDFPALSLSVPGCGNKQGYSPADANRQYCHRAFRLREINQYIDPISRRNSRTNSNTKTRYS